MRWSWQNYLFLQRYLVVFAAGLFGYGLHELIDAGEGAGVDLGILSKEAYNINPADNTHPLHEKGAIGSILKALVLYDGNPEVLRVVVYVAYWAIIGVYLLKTYEFGIPGIKRTKQKTVVEGEPIHRE